MNYDDVTVTEEAPEDASEATEAEGVAAIDLPAPELPSEDADAIDRETLEGLDDRERAELREQPRPCPRTSSWRSSTVAEGTAPRSPCPPMRFPRCAGSSRRYSSRCATGSEDARCIRATGTQATISMSAARPSPSSLRRQAGCPCGGRLVRQRQRERMGRRSEATARQRRRRRTLSQLGIRPRRPRRLSQVGRVTILDAALAARPRWGSTC